MSDTAVWLRPDQLRSSLPGLVGAKRRPLLEGLDVAGPAWATVGSFDQPVEDVMEACASLGLEGMVGNAPTLRTAPACVLMTG